VTVSPDQLQLKSQEQIEAEKKAAEEAKNAASEADASEPAETAENEQLSAEGAKAAGLAGQAATSESNAISEEQQASQQPMPQSALPGTRQTQRTYTNPAVAAAARKRAQQAGPKLGRNDPCWCGSGLKYKKCHGKDLE
jgi:preprotein translocase subunit SecA